MHDLGEHGEHLRPDYLTLRYAYLATDLRNEISKTENTAHATDQKSASDGAGGRVCLL